MNSVFSMIEGMVDILISGSEVPRFLSLCKSRGITLKNLNCLTEQKVTGTISAREFEMLLLPRRKTGVHIHILKKRGIPFFLHKAKKRKAFLVGIFLSFGILFFLNSRVWGLSVSGNSRNSSSDLLLFLKQNGIHIGISEKRVQCSKISEMIRKNYPDITWVSASMKGTRLHIEVREGIPEKKMRENLLPCDILSGAEGKIVKIVCREGIPLKKAGENCEKGDILVSGIIEIKNDEQDIIRREYVHADADVYIEHVLSYYDEFPLEYEREIPTEKKSSSFYMKMGDWYLETADYSWMSFRMEETEATGEVTENYAIPETLSILGEIAAGKKEHFVLEKVRQKYKKEEAEREAFERMEDYMKKLIEKGLQISANNVTIKVSDFTCSSKGTITVIEKTEITRALNSQEPTERNTEDGEQHY